MSGEHGNAPFTPPEAPEPPEDLAEESDGPIILPPGAACKTCHYSDVIRIQGNIQSARICRRFPPSSYFVPSPPPPPGRAIITGGNAAPQAAAMGSLMSSPPQVPDDYVCYEYDEREAPALIPTGLG